MLTPRLECIVKHIKCNTAADIGTDHAYVPIELIQSGLANHVIASDVIVGPLNNAKKNIERYNLSDKIETRLGSGLNTIKPNEVDTIIIAGMGGDIIEKIIQDGEETARASKLVLQPMKAQYELRKFLVSNGYTITGEDLAVEGFKVYNIMEVENGYQEPYENEIDYQLPPSLYKHKFFKELYDKKMREFKRITKGIENSSNPDEEKYKKFKFFLEELKRL